MQGFRHYCPALGLLATAGCADMRGLAPTAPVPAGSARIVVDLRALDFSAQDIEGIDVLKGVAASAVYGAHACPGFTVTVKRGTAAPKGQ